MKKRLSKVTLTYLISFIISLIFIVIPAYATPITFDFDSGTSGNYEGTNYAYYQTIGDNTLIVKSGNTNHVLQTMDWSFMAMDYSDGSVLIPGFEAMGINNSGNTFTVSLSNGLPFTLKQFNYLSFNANIKETVMIDSVKGEAEQFDLITNADGTGYAHTITPYNPADFQNITQFTITVSVSDPSTEAVGYIFDNFVIDLKSAAITADQAMTESNLDSRYIDVTLSGDTFKTSTLSPANFTLNNAPSGLTIESVDYLDTTHCRVNLAYDGTDFDSDISNFSIAMAGDELYSGGNLTSDQLSIAANVEPTVQTVTVPADGSYKAEDNLDFTVNFSKAVYVTGAPELGLTLGSTAKTASYVSGSGTSALVFSYKVQSGDNDNDGIAVNGLSLNGGTIQDSSLNDAYLTLNSVGATAGVEVDTVAPTVQTVTVPSNGTYKTGDNLDFTVNFSEAVTITGTPQLSLTIGSLAKTASYVSGSGTSALVFRYTIQAGDNDNDGIAVNGLSLNGGTIQDGAANDADLTLNSVGATTGVKVDTVAPTVQTVSVPTDGAYKIGDNLDFIVNFSEGVTVTGTPELGLTLGSTAKTASYVSGSGTTALVFSYTIQAGDNDNDGIAVNGLSLNGGTIKDSATNVANLTLNSVGATTGVKVDAVAPTVQTVSVPSNGTYKVGENLDFTVNFSEGVTVTGTPELGLTLGSTSKTASYLSGSGTSALVFRYTVQAGDNDNDGIAVNGLSLNGGTIKDSVGNNATLTLNSVGATTWVKVDAVVPIVSSVTVPSNGTYKTGDNLDFTVNFSEAVTITGTPQLSLTIGSLAKTATYVSGSGTSALVFRYTVQAGDNDNNGIAINELELNGGTIKDSATNAATLTLNGVGTTAEVKVDAVAPTVQTVTAPSNGSYKSGENLDFTVNFSEAVTVTGIPELSLTIGSVTRTATYISGTGTSSLVFRYTAQAGDNDNDGIAVTGLELNGGTIKDSVTNDVTLTLNGVASTTEVKVDTVVPTVQTVAVPSNGTYKTGGNLDFTVNFSEGVTVTGTPQLSLDIGGVTRKATYFSGSGTSALVFRYTVQAGDIDYNGILVGGLDLNEGRIKDSATNDATLTLNGVESTAEVKVDATAPTVQSVSVPSNGTYKAGENLDFIVNFSEGVTVTGTPQLSLNIGGVTRNATYFSGTGTTALVFRYTLQAGDNDNDGIAVNGLELSGGTIKDSAGNDATLTLNSVGTTTDVKLDTLLPIIGSATLEGNNAFIDITFSEGIYGANDGITALTADKLALTFTKNTGTATAVTISSIKRNDNTAEGSASVLTGGETTIRVFLNITGIPNGAETIEIKPANASAVYDKAGNAVLISQTTEVKTLNDKAVPAFDPATGTSLDTTHKILTLTFNENVVNALGNLDALKGAITFATDGTNYNALGTNDSVAIVNGKLVITFENVLVGNTSKIQIAGSSLKDNHDNVITGSITTNAIIANTAPAAPTGVTATAGNGSATISFTAPVDNGGSAIASYTVTSSPGSITATGNGSPIRITGLTNGVSYTFIVTATNAIGTGLPSVASNSVTPTAPYIPPSGGGGGSQPNTEPKQEQITVDVTDGTTDNVVSETVIQRTTEADGTKKDEVQYTSDKAQETVGKLKEEGKDTARIVIPDAKDEVSEAKIKIPTTTLTVMAQGNISLEIDTENARINIPKGSIKSLDGGLKEDLFFRVVPIKEEHQKREVIERAKQEKIVKQVAKDSDISVVGRPMTIETNMSQREVDIVLPLKDITIPEDPKEREEFFSKIGIFIEHSDGEKVLTKGEVVEYKKGVLGIKFRINKFSTFTIIKLNQGEFDEDGNISSNDGYGGPKTFMQDKEITITFNKDLNEKSLTKESIYVEDSKGNKVETVLKYNHAEKTVIIAPLKYYKTGEIYYLYVTDKLLSASGKTVSKKIKYGFNISNINLDKALKFEEYKEVSGNKAWTVKLNQPIDKSKFKNSDIKVYDEECNEVEVVSTIVDNKTIKVTPKKTYSKGESYYLLIDGLISDKGTGLKKVQWIKYIISDK